jgi:hypothetical protein
MSLAEYQRAVLRLCLALEPDARELPGFSLYRHMVRTRFVAMAQVAFRRSWSLLGEDACAASLARFLDSPGPRSPILREVIASFGEYACADWTLLEHAHPAALDLLRFELAKWHIAAADARTPCAWQVRELDFDGVLVPNPNLSLLTLAHEVSEEAEPSSAPDPHMLLVYRRQGEEHVHWYRAPALLADLLASAAQRDQPLAELVQAAFERRREAPEHLLEELASALSVALERGVLMGVRDPESAASPPE